MRICPEGHFGQTQNVTTAELIQAVDLIEPSDVVGQEKPMLTRPDTGEIISEFDEGATEFVQDIGQPLTFQTAFIEEGSIIALEDHVQNVVKRKQNIGKILFGLSVVVLLRSALTGKLFE